MCLNPTKIRNPYTSSSAVFIDGARESSVDTSRLTPRSPHLFVPCGKCAECRRKRVNDIVVRASVEAMTSYVYNVMMSYDDDHLPLFEFTSDNPDQPRLRVAYADVRHIQDMFKRLRNHAFLVDRDFRYLYSSEFGGRRHRPHWHLLIFVARRPEDTERTPYDIESFLKEHLLKYYALNLGTRKNPIYEPLLTHVEKVIHGKTYTNYMVKYVPTDMNVRTISEQEFRPMANLVGYIAKYFQKDDPFFKRYSDQLANCVSLDPELYRSFIYICKPKLRYSHGFGLGYYDDGSKVIVPVSSQCSRHTSEYLSKSALHAHVKNYIYTQIGSAYYTRLVSDLFERLARTRCLTVDSLTHIYDERDATFIRLCLLIHRPLRAAVKDIFPEFDLPSKFYPDRSVVAYINAADRDESYKQSESYKFIRANITRSLFDTQRNYINVNLQFTKGFVNYSLPYFYKRRFMTYEDLITFIDLRHLCSIDDLTFDERSDLALLRRQFELNDREFVSAASVSNSRRDNPFTKLPRAYDCIVKDESFDYSASPLTLGQLSEYTKQLYTNRL